MKLLVLGGTGFLGPALVEAALARGHDVTLFTRGRTRPELFPDVERLKGDRERDLSPLRRRRWDAVADTSGYVPRVVRASAELLADAVGHYTFVSTVSVYADLSGPIDEDSPLASLADETEEVTGETYGPLKALCEHAVDATFGLRSAIVRPGLIVGPGDPTGRFTYGRTGSLAAATSSRPAIVPVAFSSSTRATSARGSSASPRSAFPAGTTPPGRIPS